MGYSCGNMKAFVLLILGVASSVSAASLDTCSRGESYWCSNVKIAKECGAFKHCLTTVWPNTKLLQDSGEVCQYCENIVGDARDALVNKQDMDQIQNFLETACDMIPMKDISAKCTELVDQYLPEMFALLNSTLDPDVVCAALGLCPGFEDLALSPEPVAPLLMQAAPEQKGDVCADCQKLVQDIKAEVTEPATEKQIEELLKSRICSRMGASLASQCDAMVTTYTSELLDLLSTQVDPMTVCIALELCQQGGDRHLLAKMRLRKSPLYAAASKLQNEEECLLCKTVLGELQNMDKDPAFQAKVKTFVKTELCANLGDLRTECEQTVDTYGPMLFELLQSELDPTTDCQALGFCQARDSNTIDATRAHTLVGKPAPQVPVKAGKSPLKVGSSTQCVLCEFVIKELDGLLEQNATESEIQAALDQICSILPETIKDQCTGFVDQYAPAIIQLLLSELDPQQICTVLGLCSAKSGAVKADPDCGVCETVVQYVDSLLEENSTKVEIQAALDKVCNFLPGNLKKQCEDFVDQYGPGIIELIAQVADPKQVCTSLGLCNATVKSPAVKMEVIVPANAALLGAKECTYGPAYWCASMENAVRCKTVDHCKKHAWNN